ADAESLTTLRLSLDLAGLGAVLPGLLTRLRATLPTRPPGRGQDPAAPRVLLDRAGRPVADPQPRLPRPHPGRRPAGPPRSRATQRPRVAVGGRVRPRARAHPGRCGPVALGRQDVAVPGTCEGAGQASGGRLWITVPDVDGELVLSGCPGTLSAWTR